MTIDDLNILSEEVKDELIDRFEIEFRKNAEDIFINNMKCCKCGGSNIHKMGFTPQNKQRYKCKTCNKTMISTRDSLMFSSKKKLSQWIDFIQSLLEGDSLKVSAEKARISERNAFRWRHKVLYILNTKMNDTVLKESVSLDETLFPLVKKNKNIERSVQKQKRGISDQKINVCCAIDVKGNRILKVGDIGRITSTTLIKIFKDRIEPKSLVVTDSHRSYHKLAKDLEFNWVKIPSKKKSLGTYTLDAINRLHALLKDFTYKYKGISIRYLQGYLALFDYIQKHRQYYRKEIFSKILMEIFTARGHLKSTYLDKGCQIYP